MPVNAASHYDHVTDAWKKFMGDNFHFGYFETEDIGLSSAAERMIDKMLELCDISADSRVLDVGCGIGGPAFYMHERFGCAIDGISTSEQGVRLAAMTGEEKGYDNVRFKVADGRSTGFPEGTFDIVWVMETSHLITDKKGFLRECHRVLRDGGTLALCDLVQARAIPIHKGLFNLLAHLREYYRLLKTWGPAQLITLGTYCDHLKEAGFREVLVLDITPNAAPTLSRWRENALRYREGGEDGDIQDIARVFVEGCEILQSFFAKGIFGYGMLRARR